MFPKRSIINLPLTIDEAVDMLLADLPLADRSRLASLEAEGLEALNRMVGAQIASDFRLWSGNHELLHACLEAALEKGEDAADPTLVIVNAIWARLQATHVLRRVK